MLHRRSFLAGARTGATAAASLAGWRGHSPARSLAGAPAPGLAEQLGPSPTWGITPVVGDGHWIWTEPPAESTGYLEPRPYELKLGMQLIGTGPATGIRATTAAPMPLPEQKVESARVATQGCLAQVRQLTHEAGQLMLAADSIVQGQVIAAAVTMNITISKSYHGYERDQFPAEQTHPREFQRLYLHDSPGIQTRMQVVRDAAAEIASGLTHPWDIAQAYHQWVWENIEGRPGRYTSVVEAVREREGDCEERAATFVAFCRVSGIPARLVWVPNHNWAEFYLHDEQGEGHWIPAHTSCYSWFGWTGVHELVLQKGDNLDLPEKRGNTRLLDDWAQWSGARPQVRFLAELRPLPPAPGQDPGPVVRTKLATGEWRLTGDHEFDRYGRDSERLIAASGG